MIGIVVSHYYILEKLGQGGMGVVYKAEDTKLKRTVALKFLPPELTRDPEANERFVYEARAASALDHPNICTIHEINETDDEQLYIVMAYYDGETLKDTMALVETHGRASLPAKRGTPAGAIPLNLPLKKGDLSPRFPKEGAGGTVPPLSKGGLGGILPLDEVIAIAIQIAQGLKEAHEKGITHRDIKPANIMITEKGQVKIMDFGLAKLVGQTKMTKVGTTLGTVAYMSPEQARGEAVDHRTDIWSLGVILYEMVTGEIPFKGEYDQAVIYSILNEPPTPMMTLRPDVPQEMEKIVSTCLHKDPSARYQSIDEFLTDLKEVIKDTETTGSVKRTKSRIMRAKVKMAWTILAGIVLSTGIAAVMWYFLFAPGQRPSASSNSRLVVLPFENVGLAENEYFTDGMTEELTTRLASLSGLGVISRTSAVQYAKTNKTIEQIGKELNVSYALAGAVRWARAQDGSNRVRITPNLMRIADKTTLWAETYDRVIDDIFQVQSEISQKVVEMLGITLLVPERKNVETPPTKNLQAYQAFLRARYYEGRPHFTVENWMRVVEGYQQAVELDPGFALAFAELAKAHARFYYYWYDLSAKRLEMARRAAEQAMALSPELPAVHLALGYYHLYAYRDPGRAVGEFAVAEKGMGLNFEIYQAKAAVAMLCGNWQDGMENSRKSFELSPRDASIAIDLAEFYWILRKYEEAAKTCDLAVELAPDDAWPYLIKTFTLWTWKGAYTETRTLLDAVPKSHAWAPWSWFWQDMFERRYQEAIKNISSTSNGWIRTKCWAMPTSLLTAYAYKLLGESEKSLQNYKSAKSFLEDQVRQWPNDPRYHSSLGIAYANLGRKDDAIREGAKAVSLLTLDKDAFYGLPFVEDLAFIYTLVGETDAALDRLDYLLSIPSWISVSWLRMDPQWDALRSNPEFTKLLEKYSQKEQS